MKQVNISVRYGLAVLINDGTRQVAVGLVSTLHEDFMLTAFDNSDGIKADNLQNGIGQFLIKAFDIDTLS